MSYKVGDIVPYQNPYTEGYAQIMYVIREGSYYCRVITPQGTSYFGVQFDKEPKPLSVMLPEIEKPARKPKYKVGDRFLWQFDENEPAEGESEILYIAPEKTNQGKIGSDFPCLMKLVKTDGRVFILGYMLKGFNLFKKIS